MIEEKETGSLTRGRALKARERAKRKEPTFRRQESWRYKRVSEVWRKPRGVDSKMRKRVKGWPQSANIGYRGPKETRGFHPSGYEEVIVRNADDVYNVNPQARAIRIAHTVGMKKRVEISARARERGIRVLNPVAEKEPEEEEEEKVGGKGEGEAEQVEGGKETVES